MDVLANSLSNHMAIFNVSNQHATHFKLTQCCISIISQNNNLKSTRHHKNTSITTSNIIHSKERIKSKKTGNTIY